MHITPGKDFRVVCGVLAGIVESRPEAFSDLVHEAVAAGEDYKVVTAMRVLSRAPRAPEVDWTRLLRRWKKKPSVRLAVFLAMIRHGGERELAYVEGHLRGSASAHFRMLTEALGARWKQDGAFEKNLAASRRSCETGVPTPLDIWVLGLWGGEKDFRTLASLLAGSRSDVLVGRPLLAEVISGAVGMIGDRLHKANPIGSAEERRRFLTLDELGQMAILLSTQGRGIALLEDIWDLGDRNDVSRRVRLVARAVYAGGLGAGSHRPRYFAVLARELGIPEGEKELHRRMREAIDSVFKEPDVPRFAKFRLWQGLREYRGTLDIDVLPEFKNPLAPEKPAQSMEPDAILPPPDEEERF